MQKKENLILKIIYKYEKGFENISNSQINFYFKKYKIVFKNYFQKLFFEICFSKSSQPNLSQFFIYLYNIRRKYYKYKR